MPNIGFSRGNIVTVVCSREQWDSNEGDAHDWEIIEEASFVGTVSYVSDDQYGIQVMFTSPDGDVNTVAMDKSELSFRPRKVNKQLLYGNSIREFPRKGEEL